MSQRAQGIFISKYQKSWKPKPWQSFVDIRASVGVYDDPKYPEFRQIARDNGIAVGAVHYLVSNQPFKTQLDVFLNAAEDADYYTCDFEGIGNVKSEKFALDSIRFTIDLDGVDDKQTAFYSSPKYVQEWMYPFGIYWVRTFKNFWNAQWPYSSWNDNLLSVPIEGIWEPRLPAGCKYWTKWQYGAEYLHRGEEEGVGSDHVCLEVFNGTKEAMWDWINPIVKDPDSEPDPTYNEGWNAGFDSVFNYIKHNYKEN